MSNLLFTLYLVGCFILGVVLAVIKDKYH